MTEAGGIDRATLDWATELTTEAASRARAMLEAGGMNVTHKANGTLVTDIDREIEQFLRAALRNRFPSHAILGEEFGREGEMSADVPLWAIDPIDGTTNLANGLPFWCVSLGLIVGGRFALGVIVAPLIGETFAAVAGGGATLNGVPLSPLGPGGPPEGEDPYGICTNSVRRYDELPQLRGKFRLLGSAALEACYVAAGRTRGTQTVGVSLYDMAAAACVAGETGAEMRWLESGELYDAMEHLETGPRPDRALVTAPPATFAHIRKTLLGE